MAEVFGSQISWLDRKLSVVENALNILAGLLIFSLMFLGVAQIFLRGVFRSPIYGYIDIVEVSMVGFAVLSISYVQRLGGHVRMELLITQLRGRMHWISEFVTTLLTAVIVAILIPSSYSHFYRAYKFGDSTIDIQLLTWPAKLVVPVALSILLVRIIIQLFGYLRLVYRPDLTPIGIPVIKTVEEQAEEEIELAEEVENS